jgi:hypothetical protein
VIGGYAPGGTSTTVTTYENLVLPTTNNADIPGNMSGYINFSGGQAFSPSVVAAGSGGLPLASLYFNPASYDNWGMGMWCSVPASYWSNHAISIYVVTTLRDSPGAYDYPRVLSSGNGSGGSGGDFDYSQPFLFNLNVTQDYASSPIGTTPTTTKATGVPSIYAAADNGSGTAIMRLVQSGVTQGGGYTTGSTTTFAFTGLSLGYGYWQPPNVVAYGMNYPGWIGEVLVYRGYHGDSSPARTAVMAYLRAKWGVP